MISQDTFTGNPSDPLSLNLYTYCYNNPIRYKDSSGNFAVVDDSIYIVVGASIVVLAGTAYVATLSSTGDMQSLGTKRHLISKITLVLFEKELNNFGMMQKIYLFGIVEKL